MANIEINKYKLEIYNDGVDYTDIATNTEKAAGKVVYPAEVTIESSKKTKIHIEKNDGTEAELTLGRLTFHRKIYQPGHIEAEVLITLPETGSQGATAVSLSREQIQKTFFKKKVKLVLVKGTGSTAKEETLADNYYIHKISPRYEKRGSKTSIYMQLSIYSMDNLMRINAFSEAFLGKALFSDIMLEGKKEYVLKTGDKTTELKAEVTSLQHLTYNTKEMVQPYLVQYNETFYDFLARVANRCGEFLYFENGKLNAGINTSAISTINSYSSLSFLSISEGPLSVKLYSHDSRNRGTMMTWKDNKPEMGRANVDPVEETGWEFESTIAVPKRFWKDKDTAEKIDVDNLAEMSLDQLKKKAKDVGVETKVGDNDKDAHTLREDIKKKYEESVKFDETKVRALASDANRTDAEKKKDIQEAATEAEIPLKDDEGNEKTNNTLIEEIVSKYTESDSGAKKYLYNAEVSDEFYMPLYRDNFSNGTMEEYFGSEKNVGTLLAHVLESFNKDNYIDIITDDVEFVVKSVVDAAIEGDSANKDGNELIDTYGDFVTDTNVNTVVPFASNEEKAWVGLRYYADIKANEEKQERQSVCIDMGTDFASHSFKLGEVVTFSSDTDSRNFVVTEIEIEDAYIKVNAIPALTGTTFYPPVLATGVFRQSQPQHAVVVDNYDPKGQGCVRIRYPWQGDVNKKKAQLQGEVDFINKDLAESYYATDAEKADGQALLAKKKLELQTVEAATPWIRMVTPMATKGGGMLFVPEVGDEVLVDYENGNVERPYVVGTLYSKNHVAPNESRIIQSPNGHFIKMSDPGDANKLLSGMLPGIELMQTWHLLGDWKMGDDGWPGNKVKNMLGGITIGDKFGLYSINMSSHGRKIAISSPLGKVSIDALTGISISAPNGDVKIEGKNVTISAGNKLTLKSGQNIKSEKSWGTTKPELAKTLTDRLDDIFGNLIDLTFLRSIIEIVLKPVNGTMELNSKSFLLLEAGKGKAEIPTTAYQERRLAGKDLTLDTDVFHVLDYMIATIRGAAMTESSNKLRMLFNNASKSVAKLMCTVPDANDGTQFHYKHVFNDGGNGLVDMASDTFVKDCMEKKYSEMGIKYKSDIVPNIRQNDHTDTPEDVKKIEGLLKAAHGSLQELGKYCEEVYGMFNHMLRIDIGGAYKSLTDAFSESVDDKAGVWHWADVMKKLKDKNIKLDDLVTTANGVLTEKEVAEASETNGYTGYSEASMKEFKRKMCRKLLGDLLTNDFFQKNNYILAQDNAKLHNANSTQIEQNVKIQVNATPTPAWTLYVDSLMIDGNVADVGFRKSLGINILNNIDEKALSMSPESKMWAADMKGQILISNEPTHTIQIDNLNDSVALKKTSNNVVYKENDQVVKERAIEHLKEVLLTLGQ